MRILLAVLAVILMTSTASAGNVVSTFGTTNLKSTNWASMDCNGTQTILQCTLNGAGPDAPDGKGDEGGKH